MALMEDIMDRPVDRRHFLGLAATTGLTLAGSSRADRIVGANERVVVAVMGTGGRGTEHAKVWQQLPNVEVAYVCDADSGRAMKAASEVEKAATGHTPVVVADYRRILDDKNVDALVIATCNHWHAPATIAACAAGKHVYVEKPCSHNPWEGEMMVAAARKHDRRVQMGNQRRSWPAIMEAMELVRGGGIGRAYYAHCWYTNSRPATGNGKPAPVPDGLDYALWQGPAPRKPFRDNYLHYTWHWFWHWGNGELGNNGVHMIDVGRWGLDVGMPEKVTSTGGRYRYQDDQETPDTNMVTYVFPGNKMIVWEGLSCNKMPDDRVADVVFWGDKGSLAVYSGGYTLYDPAGKELKKVNGPGGDKTHVVNFLDSIRSSAKLNSEIEEGHRSTLLSHLGNISYRTGRSLSCDPKDGHIKDDREATKLWKRAYEPGWEPKI
jgi:predicted dehydrogenase